MDHAREIVMVDEVKWNGEEWLVGSRSLVVRGQDVPWSGAVHWNSLDRWNEAAWAVVPRG